VTKAVVLVAVGIAALYGIHRLAIWAEDRGWIYYRKGHGRSSAATNAAMQVQSLLQPSTGHMIEEQRRRELEREERGDSSDDPPTPEMGCDAWSEPSGGATMLTSGAYEIRALGQNDVGLLESLSRTFSRAFDDMDTYSGSPPSADYLERLLASECFIALVAMLDGEVVGGIAAYELKKFERERSEIYLYDLAVASAHRRRGVATALISRLRQIAHARGAWVVFVQADEGDLPAIALYNTLGTREDVMHFDISPTDPECELLLSEEPGCDA
jgi:aminoglycoside 3-N-acetyltransferase I